HGPIHKCDEIRAGKLVRETFAPKAFFDILPGDVIERDALDEHYLSIEKLGSVSPARIGNGMNGSAFGKRLEDRMQIWIAQRPDVSRFQAQRGKRVRHDWSVP